MTKSTSVFLDILRVLAALFVFASHIVLILYGGAVWMPGHAMVIVFFVLSGYVIAFSTLNKKGLTAKKYVIARLSRLYSVVIPALLLTALLLFAGRMINPSFYKNIAQDFEGLRFLATGTYFQSVWWRNLVPPENGPFWSLGYEFWYYVIFGVCIFARNWYWKIGLTLLCFLIVGANVLLLFPIWLLGVALYLYADAVSIPKSIAAVGLVLAVAATILCVLFLPQFPAPVGDAPLLYSASFLSDWLLGLALAAVIWFYAKAMETVKYAGGFARLVQWAANHSFSLYLYHYPLILFFAAIAVFNPMVWWQGILQVFLILALIIGLGELTESKRGLWKRGIEYLWERWEPPVGATHQPAE
jgi:peptidoglycan/LPS O-acetylase OafA/YrhL